MLQGIRQPPPQQTLEELVQGRVNRLNYREAKRVNARNVAEKWRADVDGSNSKRATKPLSEAVKAYLFEKYPKEYPQIPEQLREQKAARVAHDERRKRVNKDRIRELDKVWKQAAPRVDGGYLRKPEGESEVLKILKSQKNPSKDLQELTSKAQELARKYRGKPYPSKKYKHKREKASRKKDKKNAEQGDAPAETKAASPTTPAGDLNFNAPTTVAGEAALPFRLADPDKEPSAADAQPEPTKAVPIRTRSQTAKALKEASEAASVQASNTQQTNQQTTMEATQQNTQQTTQQPLHSFPTVSPGRFQEKNSFQINTRRSGNRRAEAPSYEDMEPRDPEVARRRIQEGLQKCKDWMAANNKIYK